MFYRNKEDRNREALAENGLHALADIAGWQIEPCPAFLPSAVHGSFYCATADLVLTSWRKNLSLRRLIAAGREARLDILLIEPACCAPQALTFHATLILCRSGEIMIYRSLKLWAEDVEGSVWLIPDFADRDAERFCFDLSLKKMTPCERMPLSVADGPDLGLLIGSIRWKAVSGAHMV